MNILENARKLRKIIVMASESLDDTTALEAPELFPKWDGAKSYTAGDRVSYETKLYKAVSDIPSNNYTWTPNNTPALWSLVSKPSESGTIDNPITAEAGLTYQKDKYYSEGGKIYLCTREDTENGTTLYHLPSALVGVYFSEVTA